MFHRLPSGVASKLAISGGGFQTDYQLVWPPTGLLAAGVASKLVTSWGGFQNGDQLGWLN